MRLQWVKNLITWLVEQSTYRKHSGLVRQQLCGVSVAVDKLHGNTLSSNGVSLPHTLTAATFCAEKQGLIHGIAVDLNEKMTKWMPRALALIIILIQV